MQKKEQEDAYVRLARKTIEEYACTGRQIAIPEGLPEEMYGDRAGVFVSIKKMGGCVAVLVQSRQRVRL